MNKHITERGNAMSDKANAEWAEHLRVTRAGRADTLAKAQRQAACVNAMAGVDDPVTMMAEIEDVLTRVAEHLDRYSDVNDGDYGEPEANKEMLLLSAIKPLLSRMGGENETEIR